VGTLPVLEVQVTSQIVGAGALHHDAIIAIEMVAAKMEKGYDHIIERTDEVKRDGYRTVAVNLRPSDVMAGTAGSP
jgi:hypothetical protein